MKLSVRKLAAPAGVLVLAAGIGVASAGIPSSGGKIFGCYAKKGGVNCLPGEIPLGGGYSTPSSAVQVSMSAPLPNGWVVTFSNTGSATFGYAYVRCGVLS